MRGVCARGRYPGYRLGSGWESDDKVFRDYRGLMKLAKLMRARFKPMGRIITLAYYPDGRQERLLHEHGLTKYVDAMHMMSYDQPGQHSTLEFAEKVAAQGAAVLPPELLTLGVPFCARRRRRAREISEPASRRDIPDHDNRPRPVPADGRHMKTGDWKSYEDLVQAHAERLHSGDVDEAAGFYFNGPRMIAQKTQLARRLGLGGVMIWEVGQDCRLVAVTHGQTTHGVTCPRGDESSLLMALRGEAVVPPTAGTGERPDSRDEL